MQRYGATAGGDWRRPSLRQRAGALGLTLLVQLLLLLFVILFGGARVRELVVPKTPTSVTFIPNQAARSPSAARRSSAAEEAPKPTPPLPRPPTPPLPRLPREALPYVPISRSDFAASDIARLGSAANPGAANGSGNAAAAGTGEGPGGVTLYNAEWVVEPSDAQLNPYLPRAVEAGSWALIACQTIANNRVENCAQLGEAPRGSGLSKAMRLAAWQFLIRPPRIDGKPLVGAWVRVKIEFGGEKGD